jgi:transposase
MLYVGLDLHTKQITSCVLNGDGKLRERWQVPQVDQLIERLVRLPQPFKVTYEAGCGYGRFHELLSPIAADVMVANPGQLRLIYGSKKKNDRNDAEKLAKLLYLDAIPAVHVPSAEVRAWRELIVFRHRLTEKTTRSKNGLRALLRTLVIRPPRTPGLWTQAGLAWLKALELPHSLQALRRNVLVEELESLKRQIAQVEQELARFSEGNLAIRRLRTIPGVGLRTAEAVVAFLDDPHRFQHSKQIGDYFGLVPCQDQTGNKNRLGHITRDGSATVRQLLTEAAWQGTNRSPTVRAYFERIHKGDKNRRKIALTATAHYLVRVMWSMLVKGTDWREQIPAAG